jgi:hypothetical protein
MRVIQSSLFYSFPPLNYIDLTKVSVSYIEIYDANAGPDLTSRALLALALEIHNKPSAYDRRRALCR